MPEPTSKRRNSNKHVSRGDEASLKHELRNGLAGVRGAIEIVQGKLGKGAEQELLRVAVSRLEQLDDLVRGSLLAPRRGPSNSRKP